MLLPNGGRSVLTRDLSLEGPEGNSECTKVYSNLSPSMLHYEEEKVDCYIGADSAYYHPDTPGIDWCDDEQPFGYDGVIKLFNRLSEKLG